MRKLFLAATVLIVSATAHADPSFQVATDDPPQAQPAVTAAEPAKPSEPTQAVEPAKATDPAKAAEPTPAAETKPVQPSKQKRAASRESDEHKARRIAAKFGVYW
jgi:hypothetical protein